MKSDYRVVLPLIHVPQIARELKVTIFGFMCSIQTLWGLQHCSSPLMRRDQLLYQMLQLY
jgi:hypothetical protein